MQIKNKPKVTYLDGSKLRVGIVVARFNKEVTDKLLENALSALSKSKVLKKNIRVVSVAGAIEIPFALHKIAKLSKIPKPDFLIAIGCIIRGGTPHFDYVCKMAQEGALEVMLEDDIPVGFGVLTLNNIKQAKARYHVGAEAALAGLELALLK